MFKSQKTTDTIDAELSLYESRKRLEIDEKLSDYRRTEKNRSLEEVKSYQDSRIDVITKRAAEDAAHEAKKLEKASELAKLDGEIIARKAVLETQESHRKLTAEARKENLAVQLKAADDVADARVKAADKLADAAQAETAILRSTIATFVADGGKNTEALIKALGEAASQDHSTKVIGLGVAAVNAEKKS